MISAFAPEERGQYRWSFWPNPPDWLSVMVCGCWQDCCCWQFSSGCHSVCIPVPDDGNSDRIPPWSLYQTFHGVNYLFNISSMLQINIPLSHALTRIEKHAEHNRWLKSRISAIRKMSYPVTGTGHENGGYDFPSKSCVNNLLLNSEREDSVASMALLCRPLAGSKKECQKKRHYYYCYIRSCCISSSSIWSVPFTEQFR